MRRKKERKNRERERERERERGYENIKQNGRQRKSKIERNRCKKGEE